MHIPDGFLDARTCAATFCIAGAGLAWASQTSASRHEDRTVPLLGIMSAFVFAGQMVNFPVASGTSGHLLGATLTGIVLGPAAATLSIATVVLVQCLLFQDGGVTALGANLLNMAVASPWVGWACYRLVRRLLPGSRTVAIACAAWTSVMAAAVLCSLELASAGTVPFEVVAPTMLLTHAVIGVGEALITCAVASFALRIRPDLAFEPEIAPSRMPLGRAFIAWSAAGVGLILLLAPWASSAPDGLEFAADRLGFASREHPLLPSPVPDYTVAGLESEAASTLVAGVLGTLVCLGIAVAIARWWQRNAGQVRD
jgi:cobalt/nickel transport system permease protein